MTRLSDRFWLLFGLPAIFAASISDLAGGLFVGMLDPAVRQVLAAFRLTSHFCGFDFRFGWRTFRWNYAVLYPLEAKSLLLTT
nr:MAG TPA: hypothetical protein [Caudoviricetes sp.]